MAQWAFPFQDVGGDRTYSDADFAYFFENLFTNGVFMTVGKALQVTAMRTPSMRVAIQAGAANINGRQFMNTAEEFLDADIASKTQSRMDSVVLQLDLQNRLIQFVYKANTVNVVRNEHIWELQLATINVPQNASAITPAMIQDTRSDESVCGYASPFEKVDVSGLEEQYRDMLQGIFDQAQEDATVNKKAQEEAIRHNQSSFQEWFDKLNTNLSGDVAANLQSQINKLVASTDSGIIIKHNFNGYPIVHAMIWQYGLGLVGLGDEPEGLFGGTNVTTIPINVEYLNTHELKLLFTEEFVLNYPKVTDKGDGSFLIVDGHTSIGITLTSGFTN
ncbi:structural protein [Weissella tructae]|uniref:structural protein n=1 Tax=Weissella tructae TaxID=887702 RepID=UPI003D908C38